MVNMKEAYREKKRALEAEEKALYSEMEAIESKIKHVQGKISLVDEFISEEPDVEETETLTFEGIALNDDVSPAFEPLSTSINNNNGSTNGFTL